MLATTSLEGACCGSPGVGHAKRNRPSAMLGHVWQLRRSTQACRGSPWSGHAEWSRASAVLPNALRKRRCHAVGTGTCLFWRGLVTLRCVGCL
eukprot:366563-Chlamydomonas_euryale.AAC.11